MRILHVTPSFYPAWAYGGVPRCGYELCRSLTALGEQVTVWTTDAFDSENRIEEPSTVIDGIEVRRFPNLSNGLAYHSQLYMPRGLWSYARGHIRSFDVVHIHSHRNSLELLASRAARRAGRPYIVTGHGTTPAFERYVQLKRILDALGVRAILANAASCVAVSQVEMGHYQAAGVSPSRVTVIPNGIRTSDYARLPARGTFRRKFGLGEAPVVLFVGKITPLKRVDLLIEALAQLPEMVRLVIVGNFMMPEEPIRQLVEKLGLRGRVLFPGLLVDDEKLGAYVDADIVAYPSVEEIFGLVPAEALMCGTPVVVCEGSGCSEYVRPADAGLLVPYGDVAALAAALQQLLDSPDRRTEYAARGRLYIENNLDWGPIAERTLALYRKVTRARM